MYCDILNLSITKFKINVRPASEVHNSTKSALQVCVVFIMHAFQFCTTLTV